MSILERRSSSSGPEAGPSPPGDRLRVIVAGRVGGMDARLGTRGFDVVAVAETEHDLIVAVSDGDPDAVIVEADLCESLERVRDLAPNAVVIAVGSRTPAGALGRIQRGVSGTVMAGILHALVAEGVGAAVVFGFLPALRPPATTVGVPQHIAGSLLWAKDQLVRAVETALPGQSGLVAAAGAVAVTVSASVLLTTGQPRTHERPKRLASPQAVVRASAPAPVVAVPPATRTPAHGHPSRGRKVGPHRGRMPAHGHWSRGHRVGAHRGRMPSTGPGRHDRPRSDHRSPPERPAPPARSGSLPPGGASGVDHRPPMHAPPMHAEHGATRWHGTPEWAAQQPRPGQDREPRSAP
jgi:hypothetical protein